MKISLNLPLQLFFVLIICTTHAQSRKYLHETTISLIDLLSFKNNHGLRVDSSEPWDKVTVTANVSRKNNIVLNDCDTGDLIVIYKAYVDANSTTLEHNADEGFLYLNQFDNDDQCKVLSTSSDSSSYLKKNTLFAGRKLMQQNIEIDGFERFSQMLHLTIHLELEGDLSISDIHEIVLPGNRSLKGADFTTVPNIEVYRQNSTVPDLTYFNKKQQGTPLNLQMGDSVVFNSLNRNLLIGGMADIWVAHSAGEVKFYADPSIKMGGFKPFLGYDAQVHGVKLRKYPTELDGKRRYPRMIRKPGQDYYSTYWIAQRQQSHTAGPYNPYTISNGNVRFSKGKTASDFGKTFKIGDKLNLPVQRNNQREGYNVELFNEFYPVTDMNKNNGVVFDAAKEYKGKNLVYGLDSDEIFYVNHPFAAAPSLNTGQYLLKQDVETWKILMENENEDAIAMMVSLYQANRMHKVQKYQREFYFKKYSNVFHYKGKEILDKNQYTYDANVQEKKAYFNYKRPIIRNQTSEGIPEKGAFLWIEKKSFKIPINVTVPGTKDDSSSITPFRGFYGSIIGDEYPSVKQTNVVYSIPPYYLKALGLYTLRYTYENELGLIKSIENEFDKNAQVTFDIGFEKYAKGYHDIQLVYRRTKRKNSNGSYIDTGVIVAGKELHSIALRFVSAPGSQGSEFSEDPTIFTKNGLLDLKEGRGSGNAWYLGDIIKTEDYFLSSGDRDYSVNRTYTFKQGDQIVFTAMDADPHMFIHYEPEWYVSERAMSKRLTDKDLDSRILWYLSTTRHQQDTDVSSQLIGEGRHLSYEFTEEPGVYYLSAVYNGVSEINHKIVIQPTTLTDMVGTVGFYPLQDYHRVWLQEFLEDSEIIVPAIDNLQIAKVENIHSAYTYVDGVRAPFNNHESKSNRFASQNDYYATYEVDCSLDVCIDADSFTISNENLANWFPNNWIRHYSDSPLPSDINASLVKPFDSFHKNNLSGTKFEPWQWRFPWISYTSTEGYRTRWNIKTLYDMDKLFDNENGAFSGKAFDLLKAETYHRYDSAVYGPDRDGTGIISDFTEKERLKYNFYLDLKYNRKVILNVGLLYENLEIDFFQKEQDNNRGQKVASGIFSFPITGTDNKGTVKKNSSDKEQDFLVQLLPNPTKNGQFKVYFHNNNSSLIYVEVLNALGQTTQNFYRYVEAGHQFVTIPQDQILSPGVYHLKVTMGTRTIIRKVIVQN